MKGLFNLLNGKLQRTHTDRRSNEKNADRQTCVRHTHNIFCRNEIEYTTIVAEKRRML